MVLPPTVDCLPTLVASSAVSHLYTNFVRYSIYNTTNQPMYILRVSVSMSASVYVYRLRKQSTYIQHVSHVATPGPSH